MSFINTWRNKRKEKAREEFIAANVVTLQQTFDTLVASGNRTRAFEEIMSIIAHQSTDAERKAITHWLVDLNFHFERAAKQQYDL